MNPSPSIRLLLAEDHDLFRQGLCALFDLHGGFEVVGEARTGRVAVEMARRLKPDVILMDIGMPVLNGVEATRQILAANPAAKIIVLSAHSDDIYVERLIRGGARGFIEKQASAKVLAKGIRAVAAGKTFVSPTIARRLSELQRVPLDRNGMSKPGAKRLTPRQTEVLQLVAEGFANKQIAAELNISVKTAEKHRQHLMDKIHIHDTASLTRYAISCGLIESSVQLTIT